MDGHIINGIYLKFCGGKKRNEGVFQTAFGFYVTVNLVFLIACEG